MPEPALPSFENPPLVEVVLGVQFEPLERMNTTHFGSLWQAFSRDFPQVEENAPLEPAFERFGLGMPIQPPRRPQFLTRPELPRLWFISEDESQLVQVQKDRFIHNWRKREGGYPRYESIRSNFVGELEQFMAFADNHDLGPVQPNQVEATYINHILPCECWSEFGQLWKVLNPVGEPNWNGSLPSPETVTFGASFVITATGSAEPVGRLHVRAEPAIHNENRQRLLKMTLTARGTPTNPTAASVFEFLDRGREFIVRGFEQLTTPEMHAIWRKVR